MKIIVTGSLGNISKPLTQLLVAQGHAVTVVTSDSARESAIRSLGASAAVGSLTDRTFLAATLSGADALYGMIPFSFTEADQQAYLRGIPK